MPDGIVSGLCKITLFCLLLVQGLRAITTAGAEGEVLRCYECLNTFKYTWEPYTPCQINATAVAVATCLSTDKYCKVERVTVKGITLKMARSCAGDCYYGCTFYGFGVTQLRCTSCCNESLCNTGSGAAATATHIFMPPAVSSVGRTMHVFVCVLLVMYCSKVLDMNCDSG